LDKNLKLKVNEYLDPVEFLLLLLPEIN